MPRKKQRTHNEYFESVARGNRKSCTKCEHRLDAGESIWSLGAYSRNRFHHIRDVCKYCWPQLAEELREHEKGCPDNCSVVLCRKGGGYLPYWMSIPRKPKPPVLRLPKLFDIHPTVLTCSKTAPTEVLVPQVVIREEV